MKCQAWDLKPWVAVCCQRGPRKALCPLDPRLLVSRAGLEQPRPLLSQAPFCTLDLYPVIKASQLPLEVGTIIVPI